jgi:hypothetical protein
MERYDFVQFTTAPLIVSITDTKIPFGILDLSESA